MIVRRKKGERDLFGIVIQPRTVSPERKTLYAAVLKLRRSGLQVFRAGREKHLVRAPTATSGTRISTAQLLALAAGAPAWRTSQ